MLFDRVDSLRPTLYPQAEHYWTLQCQARWLHTEVKTADDIMDWKFKMLPEHKKVISNSFGLFTMMESVVENYWSQVASWFPNPNVQGAAHQAAAGETVHIRAYINLIDTLNLGDQVLDEVGKIPALRAKIDYLHRVAALEPTPFNIAKSLAVFSAFTEGVNLFSTFALLIYFSRKGMMKGVKKTIEWSARDETLHSQLGCWLFNTLCTEQPDLRSPELEKSVIEAAHVAVQLEDEYLDFVFGDLDAVFELKKEDLKLYARYRADCKLGDIGYRPIFNVSHSLKWIDRMLAGEQNSDFFDGKPTEYASGVMNFEDAW
jgi:ribonucleoside-diphosphate reductase beta chain